MKKNIYLLMAIAVMTLISGCSGKDETEKQIDEAVRKILRLKFKLGLFDNPYVDEAHSADGLYAPEHLEAAKQCAAEGAILLKNDGILPLKDVKTLLVTGPLADAPYEQLGTWAFDGDETHTVTPLAALRKDFNVIYEPGTEYSRDKGTSLPVRIWTELHYIRVFRPVA